MTAYIDSNYFVNVRPILLEEIADLFGEDHICGWLDYSYTCNERGVYTGMTKLCGKCEIQTLNQTTGDIPYKSDGTLQYTQYANNWIGSRNDRGMFPAFRVNPNCRWGGSATDLRDLYGLVGSDNLFGSTTKCWYSGASMLYTSWASHGAHTEGWGSLEVVTNIM